MKTYLLGFFLLCPFSNRLHFILDINFHFFLFSFQQQKNYTHTHTRRQMKL